MTLFWGLTVAGFGVALHELANPSRLEPGGAAVTIEATASDFPRPVGFQMVDMGCVERRSTLSRVLSSEPQIKLVGRFCSVPKLSLMRVREVRVRNLSTGYESWLALQGEQLSSEMLVLQKGKNVIQVEWSDKLGGARYVRAEVFGK